MPYALCSIFDYLDSVLYSALRIPQSKLRKANFFIDAIGVLTKLLCNLFNFDPKNGVLSLKSASLF